MTGIARKILVPMDGSSQAEKAFDLAMELAKGFELEIIVLHVLEDIDLTIPPTKFPEAPTPSWLSNYQNKMKERGEAILTRVEMEALEMEAKIDIQTKMKEGKQRI
jgi:nucleotide-binding universal stress UspA family protein